MVLSDLRDLLLTVSPHVFHYSATDQTGNYIIWAEEGEGGSAYADNKKIQQVLHGTIDYFTKTEFDPVFQQIQMKLNSVDELAWSLNSIQYEEETGYIHYEWVWEVENDIG
ncbi:MAG: hypothetical protein N2376_03780 [Clostridia bacterium]|nr:hypothetical protein [Clostridia bacterium]